jgi:hypothetical protein
MEFLLKVEGGRLGVVVVDVGEVYHRSWAGRVVVVSTTMARSSAATMLLSHKRMMASLRFHCGLEFADWDWQGIPPSLDDPRGRTSPRRR